MNGFDRIQVRGFRRLGDFSLELRPLNVLIGANGCGKSSLLDVFSLLSASAAGGLAKKISDMGGMSSFATRRGNQAQGAAVGRVAFELALLTENNGRDPLVYSISLGGVGINSVIEEEELSRRDASGALLARYMSWERGILSVPGFVKNLTKSRESETGLSQVTKPSLPEIDLFRERCSSFVHYLSLNVGPGAPVRQPQPLRPAPLPGSDGENLASCLYGLRESNRDRFELVEDALKAAFPDFDRLEFPSVATGIIALAWRDRNFADPFYVHQFSDGMIRFLWLATLLQCPDLPSVTLLDEPDIGLHPELMSLVVGLLREASERTQLIIATQSDRFVRFLQPDEVVAFDLDDEGLARATRADELDLEEWLKDYTLDQVWSLGRIGGRS